jgi:hypothetical protein
MGVLLLLLLLLLELTQGTFLGYLVAEGGLLLGWFCKFRLWCYEVICCTHVRVSLLSSAMSMGFRLRRALRLFASFLLKLSTCSLTRLVYSLRINILPKAFWLNLIESRLPLTFKT